MKLLVSSVNEVSQDYALFKNASDNMSESFYFKIKLILILNRDVFSSDLILFVIFLIDDTTASKIKRSLCQAGEINISI